MKQKTILFLIALLLGFLFSIYIYFQQKPYYETNITLTTAVVPNSIIARIVNNLDTIISSGNHQVLAGMLQIPTNSTQTIRSIKAKELYKIDTIYKSIVNLEFVNISLQVTDSSKSVFFKQKLIDFLNNKPYITRRFDIYKKEYYELISKLDQRRLRYTEEKNDSLSNLFFLANREAVSQKKLVRLVPDEFIHLLEKQINYAKGLELIKPIELIDEYTIKVNPKWYILKYLKYSILICILFLIISEIFRNPAFKKPHS